MDEERREQQYGEKEEESSGEWRSFLSSAEINRAPGTARSEPGSPESTYHGGPPRLLQQGRGHQGTPRATLHKCGAQFAMQDG